MAASPLISITKKFKRVVKQDPVIIYSIVANAQISNTDINAELSSPNDSMKDFSKLIFETGLSIQIFSALYVFNMHPLRCHMSAPCQRMKKERLIFGKLGMQQPLDCSTNCGF